MHPRYRSTILAAVTAWLAVAPAAAQDGSIGVYADLTATQTSTTFSIGVARTIYVVAKIEGQTLNGIGGAEFRVAGLPSDWLVFVTPNPAANITLGDPFRAQGGVHRANMAFAGCTFGDEHRILLYTAVVIATSAVPPGALTVEAGAPPTNPDFHSGVLLRCNAPDFTPVPVPVSSFTFLVRAPQDMDYSQRPGWDGVRGVVPQRGLPGDNFQFRVIYSSADGLPPAAGTPQVELDANGDGDVADPSEGRFTLMPADQDSTIGNGKEYRYDVALGEPPGGQYRYRFVATDAHGANVPGAATAWRESLYVRADLADLAVHAEDIRVLPGNAPSLQTRNTIVASILNLSERPAEGVLVRIETANGAAILERTLATLPPRSSTDVACNMQFVGLGYQPIVVRVDPAKAVFERDETDNVASRGVFVGGVTSAGLAIGGIPPLVTVPPLAPFGLTGNVTYAGVVNPPPPVRGARVTYRPSWENAHTTRTDSEGDFLAMLTPPAVPGTYALTVAVSDGGRTDSTVVSVQVVPFAGNPPPHRPNLVMHMTATPVAGCPTAQATIAWSVTNAGDQPSPATTARLLAEGIGTLATPAIPGLSPGGSVTLPQVTAALDGVGLHALTAHVDPGSAIAEFREDDNAASATVRVENACLDLGLEALRVDGNGICADAPLAFSVQVTNRGCVPVTAARVACLADNVEIGASSFFALATGQTSAPTLALTALPLGCTDLRFVLEPESAAGADCEPGSNTQATSLCLAACGAPPPPQPVNYRVVACDLRASPSRPTPGQPVVFSAWIENTTDADAAAGVQVLFQVDQAGVGGFVTTAPVHAHARVLVSATSTWPADFAPHTMTVTVDPNHAQQETNESDNVATRMLPFELHPKFIERCPPAVPSMFSDCSPCVGVPIDIRAVVLNDGLFDCDSVRVVFRDSGANGDAIGSVLAQDLLAGNDCFQPAPAPVFITRSFAAAGTHEITVVVDDRSYVGTVQVGCVVSPDLIAAVALPPGPPPVPGTIVSSTNVTVTNRGNAAAFGVQARLKVDATVLCDLEMGDLAAGQSRTVTCTTPWEVVGPGCTQVLTACADPFQHIGESNETNNCSSSGVAGGSTDLAIFPYTIRVSPPNPTAFQPVVIEVGMYNLHSVESTCSLTAEYSLDGQHWSIIAAIPLHVPPVNFIQQAATLSWVALSATAALRFQLLDICPHDENADNDVAIGTLPWFDPPATPVAVSDLEAVSTPDGVVLRWSAGPGSEGFGLERRDAGDAIWERLPVTIPARAGAGVSHYEITDPDAPAGARLEYHVLGLGAGGAAEILGSVSVVHTAGRPATFALHAVRPNPIRGSGTFEFSLPETRAIELSVYDAAGRRVSTLHRGVQTAGRHLLAWEAVDASGRALPAGVYFCRLSSGNVDKTLRFVLLR